MFTQFLDTYIEKLVENFMFTHYENNLYNGKPCFLYMIPFS